VGRFQFASANPQVFIAVTALLIILWFVLGRGGKSN
jgi:hypothetical protein